MNEALFQAEKARDIDEVPVGAILVDKNGKIVASAHNLVETLIDPIAHAEILVIRDACNKLASKNLSDLDLYVTLQPCPMCLQAISLAKIKRVYFGAYDPEISINSIYMDHKPEIYGGINEKEAAILLKDFFKKKRF